MDENFTYDEKQLKAETPLFHSIPRVNPFAVPEGYFEELGKQTTIQVSKDKNDLKVPAGYFDQLHTKVMGEIKDQGTEEQSIVLPLRSGTTPQRPLHQRTIRTMYWVGGIAVAASIALLFWFSGIEDRPCETFACLLQQTELTTEDLMYLKSEDLEALAEDVDWDGQLNNENESEILDYLSEQELSAEDMELIYLELE